MKLFFTAFLSIYVTIVVAQSIIYVNQHAEGVNTGKSWEDAYVDLQQALQHANTGDEIWMAYGIYHPTATMERNSHFKIKEGIKLIGGFLGNESQIAQRNWKENNTVLSGNIGNTDSRLDNSYTVVTVENSSFSIVLDGLTIEGGYNDNKDKDRITQGNGGGLSILETIPTSTINLSVKNCTFINNWANNNGGGVYIYTNSESSSIININNCQFENNGASFGGALKKEGYSRFPLTITNSYFYNNAAFCGGGIDKWNQIDVLINNCLFQANTATKRGGAIHHNLATFSNHDMSYVTNCRFIQNKANEGGAIFIYPDTGKIHIKESEFIDNGSIFKGSKGGAIAILFSFINGNNERGIFLDPFIIENCAFQKNHSEQGGALYLDGRKLHLLNSLFNHNNASMGGAIFLGDGITSQVFLPPSKTIENCTFYKNSAEENGGVITSAYYRNSTAHIKQSFVSFNNCLFNENTAQQTSSLAALINTDLTTNNCLLDNQCNLIIEELDTIIIEGFFDVVVNHETTLQCEDNIILENSNTIFVDTINFNLSPCSPAIERGSNKWVDSLNIRDLNNNPRINNRHVDIGAYEALPIQLTEVDIQATSTKDSRDGAIEFEVKNGCPPYVFWRNEGEIIRVGTTNLATGNYRFTVTDNSGREGIKDISIPFDSLSTSINNHTYNTTFSSSISPNPSTNGLVVLQLSTKLKQEITIQFYDITGKLYAQEKHLIPSEQENKILDFIVPKGLHIVKIKNENGQVNIHKIISQ